MKNPKTLAFHFLNFPKFCKKGSGPMELCVNILYGKFVFVLYFAELNFYLNMLKYPNFSTLFLAVSIKIS